MIQFHDRQGWDVAYINPKELGEGFGRVMLVCLYNEYIYIYLAYMHDCVFSFTMEGF